MLILSSQGGIAVKKTQLIEHTKNYMDMLAQGVDPISKMKIEMDSVVLQPRMQKCFAFVAEIFDELIKNNGFIALDPEDANRYEVVEKKSSFSLRPSNRSSEIGLQEQESVDPKTGELKKQMVFTLQAQAYLLAHLDDIAACQQRSD